jgi:hypothetical protein
MLLDALSAALTPERAREVKLRSHLQPTQAETLRIIRILKIKIASTK